MLCFLAACHLVGGAGVSVPGSETQEIAILRD